MSNKVVVVTAIHNNRGGDIGCAQRFIAWLQKSRPELEVCLIVQYDSDSQGRLEGLERYATDKKIELIAQYSSAAFVEGITILPEILDDQSPLPAARKDNRLDSVLHADTTVAIVPIPNPHRIRETTWNYLFKLKKLIFPIFEYNLLAYYGNLQRRMDRFAHLQQTCGHQFVHPISMGLGSGPSTILPQTTHQKAGVFLDDDTEYTSITLDSITPKDEFLRNVLESGSKTYVGYFYQGEDYQNFEGEGRTNPWSNLRSKPGVITIDSYIETMFAIASKQPSESMYIILPGCTKEVWSKIQKICKNYQKKVPQKIRCTTRDSFTVSTDIQPEICFIHAGALDKNSFQVLLKFSESLCGSTGDQSFIEALQHGKVVLYQLMRWKTELLYSFVQLVDSYEFKVLAGFYRFLLAHGEDKTQEIAEYYFKNREQLETEAKQLAVYLKQNWNVENTLKILLTKIQQQIPHSDNDTSMTMRAQVNAAPKPSTIEERVLTEEETVFTDNGRETPTSKREETEDTSTKISTYGPLPKWLIVMNCVPVLGAVALALYAVKNDKANLLRFMMYAAVSLLLPVIGGLMVYVLHKNQQASCSVNATDKQKTPDYPLEPTVPGVHNQFDTPSDTPKANLAHSPTLSTVLARFFKKKLF
jgi:hypothetical protein